MRETPWPRAQADACVVELDEPSYPQDVIHERNIPPGAVRHRDDLVDACHRVIEGIRGRMPSITRGILGLMLGGILGR